MATLDRDHPVWAAMHWSCPHCGEINEVRYNPRYGSAWLWWNSAKQWLMGHCDICKNDSPVWVNGAEHE